MEKFIKSLFNTAERRKSSRIEESEEDKTLPPLDGRRKLSTSRSGRMKQANKKRHSLSLDVYNQNEEDKTLPPLDGRRKLSTSRSGRMKQANKKRHSLSLDVYNQDIQMTEKPKSAEVPTTQRPSVTTEHKQATTDVRRSLNVEEEIDSAFEIIHKSVVTDL